MGFDREILRRLINESNNKELFYGVKRELTSDIINLLDREEIVALSGVRRSGKSVLFNQLIYFIDKRENCLLINFEDERLINFSVNDFDSLLEAFFIENNPNGRIFLFFDEVQEVDNWEKWVRRIYDSKKNIKIFITGSSSSLLSSEFATLLTGRNISYTLYPFSFNEYLNFKGMTVNKPDLLDADIQKRAEIKSALNEYIVNGGFPAVAGNFSIDILQQYFKDIIYRDIVRRYRVRDVKQLEELYLYMLTNDSNLYTYNNLKNVFHMGIDTVKEYINYGISAYLFYDHLFFSYALKESYNKPRKTYCIDNGLRNSVSFKFSEDAGRLVENQVFIDLIRRYDTSYYYKDKNEVDFIVKDKDQQLIAVNVCYSNDIPDREKTGLLEFRKAYSEKVKEMIIITQDISGTTDSIKLIPYWKWLLSCY